MRTFQGKFWGGIATRAITLWVLAVFAIAAGAQPAKLQFEVASVKPQRAPVTWADPPGLLRPVKPGGVFDAPRATLEQLLMFAYDLRFYRIVGGPGWLRKDYFAIRAKAAGDVPEGDLKLMLRGLLEERFTLSTHLESRELQYQALVLARPDGPAGPNVSRVERCDAEYVDELRRKFPEKYSISPGTVGLCSSGGSAALADYLGIRLGAVVIDHTGVGGNFYYTLRSQMPGGVLGPERADPDLPALSTALRDQLGVRLESRKGPVEVLVIDSVHPPTED